jgi:hypothetical protein
MRAMNGAIIVGPDHSWANVEEISLKRESEDLYTSYF